MEANVFELMSVPKLPDKLVPHVYEQKGFELRWPPWKRKKHHHKKDVTEIRVSTTAKVGQVFTFTAVNDDPSGQVDPNAIDSWAEVDSAGNPASTGFIGPLSAGTDQATAPALVAGSGFVAATGKDPDGNSVTSPPYPFVVLADTDVSQVIVSGSAA